MPHLPDHGASGAMPLGMIDPWAHALHGMMANELRDMRDRLETLAGVLVADPHFAHHHCQQLQHFDYLVQHADECARLLTRVAAGESAREAIGHVRLGAVQVRLAAALNGG